MKKKYALMASFAIVGAIAGIFLWANIQKKVSISDRQPASFGKWFHGAVSTVETGVKDVTGDVETGADELANTVKTAITKESETFAPACNFGAFSTILVKLVPSVKATITKNIRIYELRNNIALSVLQSPSATATAKTGALTTLYQQTEASISLQSSQMEFACPSLMKDVEVEASAIAADAKSENFNAAIQSINSDNSQLNTILAQVEKL